MTATLILQVAAIFLMFLPGYWLRRRGVLTETGTGELARFLVQAVYPCLIFTSVVSNYSFSDLRSAWPLPLSVFLLFGGGAVIGLGAAALCRFTLPETRRSFIFQCTINNYSFLPLPIVLVLFGEKGVATLIVSSLGAELAFWSLGVAVISGKPLSLRSLHGLRSAVPLLALLAALSLIVIRDCTPAGNAISAFAASRYGEVIMQVLRSFGAMTIPAAMTIAGSSLALHKLRDLRNAQVWLACGVRLLVIPVVALLVLALVPLPAEHRQVLSIVAVMPTSVASVTISRMFGGDDRFIAGTVLLTHLLALVTVPALLGFFLR